MDHFLKKLKNKQDLTFDESKSAFELLMTGKASEDEIYNFLTLLSDKGEVANEIAGGVFILREKSKRVNVNNCIDTCGTGGDGKNTLNISTAAAINDALIVAAKKDKKNIFLSEGLLDPARFFGTTNNLEKYADKSRLIEIPLSELAVTGICIGAAMNGLERIVLQRR